MRLMANYYIISDHHFGHNNIIKYQGRPQDHDELMVKRWNSVIENDDKVLVLGDLTLVNKERTKKYTDRLKGKEKYLIRGNHDNRSDSWYEDCGFVVVEPIYKVFKDKYGNKMPVLFTHVPVRDLPEGWFNIHGHLHADPPSKYGYSKNYHFNASVEPLDYTPVKLGKILDIFYNHLYEFN